MHLRSEDREDALFLLFEKLSEVGMFKTFYLAKNDHRWVTFISLKTINSDLQVPAENSGRVLQTPSSHVRTKA